MLGPRRRVSRLLIVGVLLTSCGSSNEDEVLDKDPDTLTEKDLARLHQLAAGLSAEEFAATYGDTAVGRAIVDDLVDLIWGHWDSVPIPGAVCANGSPYKVFVQPSRGLWSLIKGYYRRLIVFFEPGGACWDYASCTGQAGIRGAANLNGIPDNHMSLGDFLDPNIEGGSINSIISPLVLRNNPTGDNVETGWWNKVFIPYCTGDVYTGNRVVTYEDPEGIGEPVTIHHKGAVNMELVSDWIQTAFNPPKRLLVGGCSAGGVGSFAHYHFLREALGAGRNALLNDSGPIFPAPGYGHQYPLQQEIRVAWNVDYLLQRYADELGYDISDDLGELHRVLADLHPEDTLSITLFRQDLNFSGYSYARFYDIDESTPEGKAEIRRLWNEDILNLVELYDSRPNLHYYLPFFRDIIESHCTTVVEWTGTEYLDRGIDVGDFIKDVLGGEPVTSYYEPDNPDDAEVTDFWFELIDLLL